MCVSSLSTEVSSSRERRWSLQLPDGFSNFAYSSTEGTPKSSRLEEDIAPNGPIIRVRQSPSTCKCMIEAVK